ncbi:MAG: PAS domain-containing protein, partial [Candidatus Thorarchaeota archaeon]
MSGKDSKIINFFLIAAFIFFVVFFSFILISSEPWVEIAASILSIGISLSVSLVVIMFALIITFGIIRFKQERMYRDYILIILAVNMIVLEFLYLITHPVNAGALPEIASRENNRSLYVNMAIIIIIALAGLDGISNKRIPDEINKILHFVFFILTPCFSILSAFSTDFIIQIYNPSTGITVVGYILIPPVIGITLATLVISLNRWRKTKEWFDLSIAMATTFWFVSVIGFTLQTSPFQLIEIVRSFLVACGYGLISGAMMMEAILDPYRGLETRVSQIDEALRNSEERLQLALSGADLGVWDWFSISNLYIIDSRFAEILGYENTEMILTSQDWKDMLHPDDLELALSRWELHVDGEYPIYSSEHRLKRKTGEYVWVLERGKIQ